MARCQRHEFSIAELIPITDAFLAFMVALQKSRLTPSEKSAYVWILKAWETRRVRNECVVLDKKELSAITFRMERLRGILHPDPVKKPRISTVCEDLPAHLSNGNHKTIMPTSTDGESDPLLEKDIQERFRLLRQMMWSIEFLMREIWVHEGSRRDVPVGVHFERFQRAGRRVVAGLDPHGPRNKEAATDDD